jgi:2-polyprenyl-3-methyl-5-hydroxy-6-metoxy-1,4-benzoquinol methylase
MTTDAALPDRVPASLRLVLQYGGEPQPESGNVIVIDDTSCSVNGGAGLLLADQAIVAASPVDARALARRLSRTLHERGVVRVLVDDRRLFEALGEAGFTQLKDECWQRAPGLSRTPYDSDYIGRWGDIDFLANWRVATQQILTHLPRGVSPREVVILDVGCMNGYMMESLRLAGVEHTFGCDISPTMAFDHCVNRWHWPAIRCFDFCENDYPGGIADMVLCMEVLEHVPRHKTSRFIAELARVLKPTGVLLASISEDWLIDDTHINCRSRISWYAAFARAGLLPHGKQVVFPGFNSFVLRHAPQRWLATGVAAMLGVHQAVQGDSVLARRPAERA